MTTIIIHRSKSKDADFGAYNSGLKINVMARVQAARLPRGPAPADIAKARDELTRAKNDIDGLMVYLR